MLRIFRQARKIRSNGVSDRMRGFTTDRRDCTVYWRDQQFAEEISGLHDGLMFEKCYTSINTLDCYHPRIIQTNQDDCQSAIQVYVDKDAEG